MAEKARLQAIRDGTGVEEDKEGESSTTTPSAFLRPSFVPLNSSISGVSQIGLLDSGSSTPYGFTGGRSRADTINSERSMSLYSPSMPHLPYARESEVDYFSLETLDKNSFDTPTRRGSF